MKDITLTLVEAKEWRGADGCQYRREKWTICGGEIDPTWRGHGARAVSWGPSSRFTLYAIDGEVDTRLASYGGVVWPIAWPALFRVVHQGTYQAAIVITAAGLRARAAAITAAAAATNAQADARLS